MTALDPAPRGGTGDLNALNAPCWSSYAAGYEAGVTAGMRRGWQLAQQDMAATWAQTARRVRELAQRASYNELQRRRGEAA